MVDPHFLPLYNEGGIAINAMQRDSTRAALPIGRRQGGLFLLVGIHVRVEQAIHDSQRLVGDGTRMIRKKKLDAGDVLSSGCVVAGEFFHISFPRWQSARCPRHTDYIAHCQFLFDSSWLFGTVQGLHNAGMVAHCQWSNSQSTVQIEVAECKLCTLRKYYILTMIFWHCAR